MTNDVKIFAKTIEQEATEQIEKLSHHPVSDGSKVRIMPDVHAGAGCTIGTTMTIHDRVCPNLVGVDIGCGMLAVKLGRVRLDLDELDKAIRWNVPAGFCTHNYPKEWFDLSGLKCVGIDNSRALLSIGTLGGGNHFIEVDKDKSGGLWLVIHTGSRKLGLEVANWHQRRAMEAMTKPTSEEISRVVAEYKAAGRQKEIAGALEELRKQHSDFGAPDLAYLTGELMDDYLSDMKIIQRYAEANRQAIAKAILKAMHIVPQEQFTTVHNYIDHESMILRKGAVSAKKGERLIIPMNMRDGSLICGGIFPRQRNAGGECAGGDSNTHSRFLPFQRPYFWLRRFDDFAACQTGFAEADRQGQRRLEPVGTAWSWPPDVPQQSPRVYFHWSLPRDDAERA